MNDLVKIETTQLKNKELKKDINALNRAFTSIGKSTWQVADTVKKIIDSESYEEDFKNLDNLGAFIGFSASTLSRMANASELHGSIERLADVSMSKVMELLTLGGYLQEFLEEYKEIDLATLTVKKLRDYIKIYKAGKELDEEAATEPEEAATEPEGATTEPEEATTESEGATELEEVIDAKKPKLIDIRSLETFLATHECVIGDDKELLFANDNEWKRVLDFIPIVKEV